MAKRNYKNNKNKTNYRKDNGNRSGRPKEVEIDIDRDDINEADLSKSAKNYKSKKNDASWYAKNPALLQAAANFPFGYPIGAPLVVNNINPNATATLSDRSNVPGIETFYYVPTIGRSNDGTSPVNLAAKLAYSNIRYANSGTSYGDPSDLMMYFLAIDSMYTFHQFCARAYGIMRTYNYENRYYPKEVIHAMGLDFDDLNANINQLFGFINTMGVKLQSFAVPGDMSYFIRHAWLTSGIYLDSATSKSQSYMFVPIGYYQWTEVTEGPNKLTMISPYKMGSYNFEMIPSEYSTIDSNQYAGGVDASVAKLKLSDLMSFADSLMAPVLESESFGLTTGAILKSYGRDNLMKVGQIDMSYTVIPSYNEEVMSQIENATVFTCNYANTLSQGYFDITQSSDVNDMYITSNPTIYAPLPTGTSINNYNWQSFAITNYPPVETLINMHMESPTPADFVVATRLTATVDPTKMMMAKVGGSNFMMAQLLNFGSEVILGAGITTLKWDKNVQSSTHYSFINYPVSSAVLGASSGSSVLNQVHTAAGLTWNQIQKTKILPMLQDFDWHQRYVIASVGDTESLNLPQAMYPAAHVFECRDTRDIDNFAIVNDDNLALLNQVSMLSLFDSPRVAELTSKPYKR